MTGRSLNLPHRGNKLPLSCPNTSLTQSSSLPLFFNMPVTRSSKRNKKSTDKRTSEIPEVAQEPESGEEVVITEAVEQFVDKMTGIEEAQGGSSPEDNGRREENDDATNGSDAPKLTMEERKAKLAQLRKKIVRLFTIHYFLLVVSTIHQSHRIRQAASAKANRVSLIEESAKAKITVRDAARLDRQRKLAEALRQKADAEERGDDVERHKNWEWTIEENDNWEKKLARKARRADFEFHGGQIHLFGFLAADDCSLQMMLMQRDGDIRKI